MRRLRFLLILSLLAFSFLGSSFDIFSTSNVVYAQQNATVPTATVTGPSKEDLQRSGEALFNTFIAELQSKQADPSKVPNLTNATQATIDSYVSESKNVLVPFITKARDLFTSTFNTPAGPSSNIYANYSAALLLAKDSINIDARTLQPTPGRSFLRIEVRDISDRLTAESLKEQRAQIAAGNTAGASAIQNAVGQQRAVQPDLEQKKDKECSLLWMSSVTDCITIAVEWIIKNILLEIAGFLVWVTANMFNYAVQIGILDFAKWAPTGLYPIWLIIRQIISLVIVFVGLYLGFLYIIGDDTKFQRYMPFVVLFALFVNFSYPLVRTAVDISNIVSLNVYTSAVGSEALNPSSSGSTPGAIIMSRLGLEGLVFSAVNTGGVSVVKGVSGVPGSLLTVAYVLYAAYIFLLLTGIIVFRTAALIFLIVASPLLLVDSVLPVLGNKAQQLRKILFEQLTVGPVFMIMLALTLKFLEVFSSGPLSGAASGTDKTIVSFFNVLMMLIMLHIMITVTKNISGTVGEYATKTMGMVGGFGLGVATGGAGLLARGTMGKLAMKARESKWVTNNQDSFLGKRAYNLSNSVANSTFDLRNSSVVAGKMKSIGMGMGMGAKMGYEESRKKADADVVAARSRIKTRYERDKYKMDPSGKVELDSNGNAVLLQKKGDIDQDGLTAQRRFIENNGGSRFLTKKEKEALNDKLWEDTTKENEAVQSEIKEETSKEVEDYSKIKGDLVIGAVNGVGGLVQPMKQRQADFIDNLKKQLAQSDRTDPNRLGKKALTLEKALEEIDAKNLEDGIAFSKERDKAIKEYQRKNEKSKKEYYDSQSKAIKEELDKHIQSLSGTTANQTQDTQTATPSQPTSAQPISTPQPTVQTASAPQPAPQARTQISTEHVQHEGGIDFVPANQAPVQANNVIEYTGKVGGASPSTPIEKTKTFDLGKPYDVNEVSTLSFAERQAAKRAADTALNNAKTPPTTPATQEPPKTPPVVGMSNPAVV